MTRSNRVFCWRYKIKLTYLDKVNNKSVKIKNECLKSLIIDHNISKGFANKSSYL